MRKRTLFTLIVVIAAGWFLLDRYEVRGLSQFELARRGGSQPKQQALHSVPPPRAADTIRIASFNIQHFGPSKKSKTYVMDYLARIVRQFDVVAVQEIRSKDEDLIPHFVDLINSSGRYYDFVIGPRLGRTTSKEQYVFLFDQETIEVDRTQLYTVDDPDDLLHREPLVSWFRVRGPSPGEAFTFSLVNIHTDPDEVPEELAVMDDVYYAVLNDGRGEDDVIVLGDFNADYRHLGPLSQIPQMTWVIFDEPTNTIGKASYDNLVFHRGATREFVGRRGVFDFMRQYNLTLDQAKEVSDHLPVWGEFSVYENGQAGRVATRAPSGTR